MSATITFIFGYVVVAIFAVALVYELNLIYNDSGKRNNKDDK